MNTKAKATTATKPAATKGKTKANATSIAGLAQGMTIKPPLVNADGTKTPEAPAVSKSVIPTHYRKQYKVFRADEQRTSGGNPTINNGDNVAMKLLGKTVKEVFEYVAEQMQQLEPGRGITVAGLEKKYEGKNDGMKRMNAGNILRNTIKRMAGQPQSDK